MSHTVHLSHIYSQSECAVVTHDEQAQMKDVWKANRHSVNGIDLFFGFLNNISAAMLCSNLENESSVLE